MTEAHTTDVLIIGAGPVGLFAIFQAGMLGLSCQVVDTLEFTGGQCTALYPEKPIYDIPGFAEVEAARLIRNLEEQAEPFSPTYHLGQQVTALTQQGDRWIAETSKGTKINASAVIIAAGCGAFGPNRPPLDGIENFEGSSVFYMVGRREDFRDKRLVIAGGGDSALDWAISLSELAAHVYMVHRRPKFRGAPDSVAKLHALVDAGKIELVVPYQLARLEGISGELDAVVVSTLEGEERRLEADALLPFFGLSMELGPIANWGLGLHQNHIAVEASTMETSAKGIYAVGDIAHYPGKLKLILCGFSEAAMALHDAFNRARPGEALHFEYSTSRGVPA